jgi:hypothetical protein
MLGMLGGTYIKLGKIDEAKKLLAELQTPPINNDKLFATGTIKNLLGETDESFKIFNKLIDEKYGVMIYMKVESDLFRDTKDPRFLHMLKKIGF